MSPWSLRGKVLLEGFLVWRLSFLVFGVERSGVESLGIPGLGFRVSDRGLGLRFWRFGVGLLISSLGSHVWVFSGLILGNPGSMDVLNTLMASSTIQGSYLEVHGYLKAALKVP